jgi:hypothetical protein
MLTRADARPVLDAIDQGDIDAVVSAAAESSFDDVETRAALVLATRRWPALLGRAVQHLQQRFADSLSTVLDAARDTVWASLTDPATAWSQLELIDWPAWQPLNQFDAQAILDWHDEALGDIATVWVSADWTRGRDLVASIRGDRQRRNTLASLVEPLIDADVPNKVAALQQVIAEAKALEPSLEWFTSDVLDDLTTRPCIPVDMGSLLIAEISEQPVGRVSQMLPPLITRTLASDGHGSIAMAELLLARLVDHSLS